MSTDNPGFTVGVLRISWLPDAPYTITGHPGQVYSAQLAECHTRTETLPRDAVNAALRGVVVRAPDGKLSVIRGVESYATMHLHAGMPIGLLLVPMEEM